MLLLLGLLSAALGAEPDWAERGRQTALLLSQYLRVDTTNPPGNETAGARFLAGWLERRGVEADIWEHAPGRGSLVARVRGTGELPPLCLLSHIDVATAEAERWPEGKGPLSGTIDADGRVWGRGALDMKGMGALQAMILAMAAEREAPLRRDLILLAVADEEVDNEGAAYIASRWSEIGCSHLVNEGGFGIADMLFPGQTVFPISVGEKGVLWLELTAEGAPGHGSVPLPDQAPERIARAVLALQARTAKPRVDPTLLELLARVGEDKGGLSGAVLRRPWLVKTLVRKRLMDNPLTRAAMTDTAHVTGLRGAEQPNVVPSRVQALVDSRLQPGTAPEAMRAEIQAVVGEDIHIEVLQAFAAQVSEWRGDPFYEALARRAVEEVPGSVAGPVISVGFTDSILLRPLGVRAYGFVPFVLTEAELRTMHGDGEHVSIENLRRGLRVLWQAVMDVSAPEAAAGLAAPAG